MQCYLSFRLLHVWSSNKGAFGAKCLHGTILSADWRTAASATLPLILLCTAESDLKAQLEFEWHVSADSSGACTLGTPYEPIGLAPVCWLCSCVVYEYHSLFRLYSLVTVISRCCCDKCCLSHNVKICEATYNHITTCLTGSDTGAVSVDPGLQLCF